MQRSARLLLLVFFPASVLWSSAGGIAFWLLAIAGAVHAVRSPGGLAGIRRHAPELALASALPVAMSLASVLAFGLPAREFSWFVLLAAPAIASLALAGCLPLGTLHLGAALGGAAALVVVVADWTIHGSPRPTGSMNAIVFGQIAFACSVCAIAGVARDAGGWRVAACVGGTLAGLAAAAASGTRGVFVAIPVLLVLVWRARRETGVLPAAAGGRWLLVAAGALTAAAIAIGPRLPIWERFGELEDEYLAYRSGSVGDRSFALRLAMWEASLALAAERPLLGHGAHRFKSALAELQSRGGYPKDAFVYAHPHNLFLSVLVQYGVVGLAVLMLSGWLAWRAMSRAPPQAALLGRLSIAMWALFGLTNDVLAHQNTMRVLALTLAVCAAAQAPRLTTRSTNSSVEARNTKHQLRS